MSWVIGCPDCGGTLLVSPGTRFKDCPCGHEGIDVGTQVPAEPSGEGSELGVVGQRQGLRQAFGIGLLVKSLPVDELRPSHPLHPSSRYLVPPRVRKRLVDWPHNDPVPRTKAGDPCELCLRWGKVCNVHDGSVNRGGGGPVPKHLPEEYHGAVEVEGDSLLPP